MRSYALLAGLLVACSGGAGGAPPDYEGADAMVEGLCNEWEVTCTPVSGSDLYPFAWARYYHTGPCGGGRISWDRDLCASDTYLCEAIIMHEIGHKETCIDDNDVNNNNEFAADAWVVANGTEDQIDALVYLLCTEYELSDRCSAVLDALDS